MGLMNKHWLVSEVIFSKENNMQRSVLGPLLFFIYVNDFYRVSKSNNVMFADDKNLFISDANIGELFQQANKERKSVSTWFKANKLSINIDKTK